MIIGYMRVSTSMQDFALQEDAIKAAGCEKIFQDVASGSKDDRPNLMACLRFLKQGDTLVIWKIDRLSRSLRHLINTIMDLQDKGIAFRVLTGAPIDTSRPEGRLILAIFAGLAEFERSLIRERVNAGIKAAKVRGVKFGRPKKISPEMLERARGRPHIALLAKELGVSRSTLYEALQR